MLFGTGLLFYFLQNNELLPGGGIAIPKLFWLGTVVLCWYIIPAFLWFDRRLAAVRTVIGLFLLNMIVRGAVELWMMYGLANWHPYYGIAHDIVTSLLCLALALHARERSPLIAGYLVVNCALFLIEAGFARYMLLHVEPVDGPVYFVPPQDKHTVVLGITTLVIAATAGYLFIFVRKWFHATASAR